MAELCYVCTRPFTQGEKVYQLVEQDTGLTWYIHVACIISMRVITPSTIEKVPHGDTGE